MRGVIFLIIILNYIKSNDSTKEDDDDLNPVDIALIAEKNSRNLSKIVIDEYNAKMILKLAEFEHQKSIHRNHSIGTNDNNKWLMCLELKNKTLIKNDDTYNEMQGNCTLRFIRELRERKLGMRKILKEIRDWRNNYHYLKSLCKESHLEVNQQHECLQDYLENDNYTGTLETLLGLLDRVNINFQNGVKSKMADLDYCLQNTFSAYLERIRYIMDELYQCYNSSTVEDLIKNQASDLKKKKC